MQSMRAKVAAAVVGSATAICAVWAIGARSAGGAGSESRPRTSRDLASSASDARVAALEARLTRIERAITALASREASAPSGSGHPAATPDVEASSGDVDTDPEPPASPAVALQELYTSLDQRLEAEAADPAWRPEPEIREAVRSLSTQPNLVSTDCVSAFCRVALELRAPEDVDASAEQIARLPPFSDGTLYQHDPAEPLRLVLYVQRPGHPLGEEAPFPSPTTP